MKKFIVLFYRPKLGDGNFIDDGIYLHTLVWNPQTWGKGLASSHVEIWTPDDEGRFVVVGKPVGYCWSSTFRKGKYNGTRRASAEEILKHPERWYGYLAHTSDIAFEYALREMEMEVANNKGYDFTAIASYFTPWRWGDKEKNICSEFCARIINTIAGNLVWDEGWWNCFRKLYKPCPSPLRLSGWLRKCGLTKFEVKDFLKG